MKTVMTAFELASEIAVVDTQESGGHVTVLPVVVEDLRAVLPALVALSEMMEGHLFDMDEPESWPSPTAFDQPLDGVIDPVRRTAVETILNTLPEGNLQLYETDEGQLDIGVGPKGLGDLSSGGERTLARIIRAVLHPQIDIYPFVTIVYSAESLDLHARKAAWHLMVQQLDGVPSMAARTLLVVVQDDIDVDLHCTRRLGLRFAVRNSRLLWRQGADDLRATAGEIAEKEGPLIFFLGAGFSVSSRMPLGDDVRDGAIRNLLKIGDSESLTSRALANKFHEWLSSKPGWIYEAERTLSRDQFVEQLTLERVVDAEHRHFGSLPTLVSFQTSHEERVLLPGSAVGSLLRIMENGESRVIIVQVNFDELVERNAVAPIRTFVNDADFGAAPDYIRSYLSGQESAVPILKLHGTISEPSSCVVSLDQASAGIGNRKLNALRALLGNEDQRHLWLYVGASLRDRDLLPVLSSEEFAHGLDERWVLPFLVESVWRFGALRTKAWSGSGRERIEDRVITFSADTFLAELEAAWRRTT